MYSKYYGFKIKPFENTPDPYFLYLSQDHREILASLLYGVHEGKGFIAIVGDVGTGKTTLIKSFIDRVNKSFIVFHIVNSKLTFEEILLYIAHKLDIDIGNKTVLERTEILRNSLEKLDNHNMRVVLIFDEAHHLSDNSLEEIRLLSNIETTKKKLIQIVLVGQNELYQTLQKKSLRQLKQRIVINRVLEPLNKEETLQYIQHRLNISGNTSSPFTRKALLKIWKKSNGIPRIINHICDNALLIGFAIQSKRINSKVVDEVVADMVRGPGDKKKNHSRVFNIKRAGVAATLFVLILLYNFPQTTEQYNTQTDEQEFSNLIKNSITNKRTVESPPLREEYGSPNLFFQPTHLNGDAHFSQKAVTEPVGNTKGYYSASVTPSPSHSTATQDSGYLNYVQETDLPSPTPINNKRTVDSPPLRKESGSPALVFQPTHLIGDAHFSQEAATEPVGNTKGNYSASVNSLPSHSTATQNSGYLNYVQETDILPPTTEVSVTKLEKGDDENLLSKNDNIENVPLNTVNESSTLDEKTSVPETIDIKKNLREIKKKYYKKSFSIRETDYFKRENNYREIVIKTGDNITHIAKSKYGLVNDTITDIIQINNNKIKNIDLIYAGENIILPDIKKKDLIVSGDNGKYYIYYAAFYSLDKAENAVDELNSNNHHPFVVTVLSGGKKIHRVYLGEFDTFDDCKQKLSGLRLEYLPFLKN